MQGAAWLKDASDFQECGVDIRDAMDRIGDIDRVKAVVGKMHSSGITNLEADVGLVLKQFPRRREHFGHIIDANDFDRWHLLEFSPKENQVEKRS